MKWKIINPLGVPQQMNGYDCGPYVYSFIEQLSRYVRQGVEYDSGRVVAAAMAAAASGAVAEQ